MKQGLILLGFAFLFVLPLSAQDEGGPPAEEPDSLVFEREVFDYPQYDRRNPFAELLGSAGGGPRFEQLTLKAIVYTSDPRLNVATFSTSTGDERRPGSTVRARVGDRIGNSLVLEILERSVVLEVDEFGLTDRRVIELRPRTEGQGGPS